MPSLVIIATICCALLDAQELPVSQEQLQPRHHAQATVHDQSICLRFNSPEWSAGVRILPPPQQTTWDFSQARFLAVDVENLSPDHQLRLTMHLASGSRRSNTATQNQDHTTDTPIAARRFRSCYSGIGLNPGEKRTLRLELPHTAIYEHPDSYGRRSLDSNHINAIDFEMQWPFEPPRDGLVYCRLSALRLEGQADHEAQIASEHYLPFVDAYGQYRHAYWPEKIRHDAQLPAAHAAELAELHDAPASWDQYGGWLAGPRLESTGAFRTAKYHDRWYFVSPAGTLFWSLGIDVLRSYTDATNASKNPEWFTTPLPDNGILPFTHWNLQKKYGRDDYADEFYAVLLRRLRSWGINTIGNWGAKELMASGTMPYTLSLGDFTKGITRLPKHRLYDVFAADFAATMGNLLRDRAAADPLVKKSLDDPMCIGYFIDNELPFNKLSEALLQAAPDQPARQAFIRQLQDSYPSVQALNQAWGSDFTTWDKVAAIRASIANNAFRADFRSHARAYADRYFAVCRQAIKAAAPHRLYLGCRFIGFRQADYIWDAAARHCDVLSVNAYSNSVANVSQQDLRDKPLLLGEFHFGTYDRGMFSPGLCPVVSQNERATSYIRLVQGALAHPNFVGAHYFQFRDQPLTGRHDGEGYQIGFVDVCDTPYPEMTTAARQVGSNMYHYREARTLKNNME